VAASQAHPTQIRTLRDLVHPLCPAAAAIVALVTLPQTLAVFLKHTQVRAVSRRWVGPGFALGKQVEGSAPVHAGEGR
jgi:hypothetical protein